MLKKIMLYTLFTVIVIGIYFLTTSEGNTISIINEQVVEEYLSGEVMKSNFGGEIFVAYEILGTDKKEGEIYLWALIEEYYEDGGALELGTGMSAPIVLNVHSNDSLEIISHSLPRDGSLYSEDIKEMFPKKLQYKISRYPSNHIHELIEEMENKVKVTY